MTVRHFAEALRTFQLTSSSSLYSSSSSLEGAGKGEGQGEGVEKGGGARGGEGKEDGISAKLFHTKLTFLRSHPSPYHRP